MNPSAPEAARQYPRPMDPFVKRKSLKTKTKQTTTQNRERQQKANKRMGKMKSNARLIYCTKQAQLLRRYDVMTNEYNDDDDDDDMMAMM